MFTPSVYFPLSFTISLVASLIVNLSPEFHTKCVFPFCLISSKPSVTQQICNELAFCQGGKKKWHHFQKGGDQHFNLSEIENRTKEMPGRSERGRDGAGAWSFSASPCFVHRALEIWNPFVFHSLRILLAMQSLVWNNYWKIGMAFSCPAFVSLVGEREGRRLDGLG